MPVVIAIFNSFSGLAASTAGLVIANNVLIVAGFSDLVNSLFFRENTRMIYGDAKETSTGLVTQFKD